MKAYKFASKQHADLVTRGSVKLSSADSLRQMESDGTLRGDPNELATKAANISGDSESLPGDHPLFCDSVHIYQGGERMFPEMTVVGETVRMVQDALLYCCSLADNSAASSLGDALFEIADVEEFGRRLSKHPELKWRKFESGHVHYAELERPTNAGAVESVNPFLKDISYSGQQEFRLLWAAQPWETEIIIEAPEVAELMKRKR